MRWFGTVRQERRFERLLEPTLPSLWRFALRLTRNSVAAEDLLHNAIERAMPRIDQLLEDGAFRTWMHRVVYRTFLNERARRCAKATHVEIDNVIQLAAVGPMPSAGVEARLLGDQIDAAVVRLPAAVREAVIAIDAQGLSYDEASTVLGIPRGTVASRVARGRAMLREWLRDVAVEQGVC